MSNELVAIEAIASQIPTRQVYEAKAAAFRKTSDLLRAHKPSDKDVRSVVEKCHLGYAVIQRGDVLYCSHKGELLTAKAFRQLYCNIVKDGHVWLPSGQFLQTHLRTLGIVEDKYPPLYYRDYTAPLGYFNGTSFNIAEPYKHFPAATGADTTFIHTYLQHLCGDAYPYVITWLKHKYLYPNKKQGVVVVLGSAEQGTGKSTFAEVICRCLFGNHVVCTSNFDPQARFNSDWANALVCCIEEQDERNSRLGMSALKALSTSTTVRVELKGQEPMFVPSCTDFVVTTNRLVPFAFEGYNVQRRLLMCDVDPKFNERTNAEAREVFDKLYGRTTGLPLYDDDATISQFLYELIHSKDADMNSLPVTESYKRCLFIPRTKDTAYAEALCRALVSDVVIPSLESNSLTAAPNSHMAADPSYMCYKDGIIYVLLSMLDSTQATPPATMLKTFHSLQAEMRSAGVELDASTEPVADLFPNLRSELAYSQTLKFRKYEPRVIKSTAPVVTQRTVAAFERSGKILYYDEHMKPCSYENRVFETLNGINNDYRCAANANLEALLLESDTVNADEVDAYVADCTEDTIDAEQLYATSLAKQLEICRELLRAGILYRAVYSGSKSIHLVIVPVDTPSNLDEYHWLHGYICMMFNSILFDMSVKDPSRLTRSDREFERRTEHNGITVVGKQRLLINPKARWNLKWREAYEMSKELSKQTGKMYAPCKSIYREGATAILDGSFWIDNKWDGQRNTVFFPAYRALVYTGHSHDEIWNRIKDTVNAYPKASEISYWLSREHCSLIHDIEESIMNMEVDDGK